VMVISLFCAIPVNSRANSRRETRLAQNGLTVVLWLFFLVPGVVLGIGLIKLFVRIPFIYQTPLIVIIAFTLRYVAFGWTSMKLSMAGMDPSLTDAARVFGASRWQMLAHVCWPQIAPMVFAAAYIVFLLGLWDVESIIMVVPPGGETLS